MINLWRKCAKLLNIWYYMGMRIIARLLLVVLGFIYYPLNLIYVRVKRWYLPMWKKDKVVYFAFAPFYWILVGLVTVISYPYELLMNIAH